MPLVPGSNLLVTGACTGKDGQDASCELLSQAMEKYLEQSRAERSRSQKGSPLALALLLAVVSRRLFCESQFCAS